MNRDDHLCDPSYHSLSECIVSLPFNSSSSGKTAERLP
jgi:hypothetical protein